MNRKPLAAFIMAAALLLGACGSDAADTSAAVTTTTTEESSVDKADNVVRMRIKPDLVDCVGVTEQTCMQIAEGDGDFEYFYDQIDGFTFVEGTSYVLDVRVDEVADPPADGSSLAYTLVEVVEEN